MNILRSHQRGCVSKPLISVVNSHLTCQRLTVQHQMTRTMLNIHWNLPHRLILTLIYQHLGSNVLSRASQQNKWWSFCKMENWTVIKWIIVKGFCLPVSKMSGAYKILFPVRKNGSWIYDLLSSNQLKFYAKKFTTMVMITGLYPCVQSQVRYWFKTVPSVKGKQSQTDGKYNWITQSIVILEVSCHPA